MGRRISTQIFDLGGEVQLESIIMWKLFIDDERYPIDETMVIARSVKDAIELINLNGCPIEINFDHDLGDNVPTGFHLAQWLVEKDLDENGSFLPNNFTYYIHSQNPIGRENIDKLLSQYLNFKLKSKEEIKYKP